MSEIHDELSSDEDDDLILQLSSHSMKKASHFPSVATQQHSMSSKTGSGKNFKDELVAAQGEASMLRDKIFFLNDQVKREKQLQVRKNNELTSMHREELAKVKLELQNLEDEKKFLLMEIRKANSSARSKGNSSSLSAANPDLSTPASADELTAIESNVNRNLTPPSKKRKLYDVDAKKNFILINPGRGGPDETEEFFDFLLLHKIVGSDLTTIQILSQLELRYIEEFNFKELRIRKGQSIGKELTSLLLRCKKALNLDKFIDTLLESIAVLIKEISLHAHESNLAIPFLVTMMYQTVVFRPSAIHTSALKDLLHFISDLIQAFQHVLKQSLHQENSETCAEPQIVQYELVDFLIVIYSFDTLESSLRILRYLPSAVYRDVLDCSLLQSLEYICKSAMAISYRPIMNVVFNAVEILNILSGMMVECIANDVLMDGQWWKNLIPRLYHILGRDIQSLNAFSEEDGNVFSLSRFHDCFGLIRNIGSNSIGMFVPRLIFSDRLQAIPRVISKDDIPERSDHLFGADIKLEGWFLLLKDNILNLLENLLALYPNDAEIVNGEMLIQLARLMAKEQEHMMERYVGQDSDNLYTRCELTEHLLTLIFWLWTDHENQLAFEQVKEIESEMVMLLWRVLVSGENSNFDPREMSDHSNLVDSLFRLQLKDEISFYNDAFGEMPEFIKQELKSDVRNRAAKIMQIRYDERHQHMARIILESKFQSMASMEDIDSLYVAMGL